MVLGCGSDPTKPAPPPTVDSPAALVGAIADAYRVLDFSRFERLISQEPRAEFGFQLALPLPSGRTSWDAASELNVNRRMLVPPSSSKAGESGVQESPVPAELHLASITIALTPVIPFTEIATPQGLDPERWHAFEATYAASILFDTQGSNDFRIEGRSKFVVIQDLSKAPGDAGQFLLYRWMDRGQGQPANATRSPTWGEIKLLYAGGGPATPAELIRELQDAYAQRDFDAFKALFPGPEAGTPYLYYLADRLPNGHQAYWDLDEELRIHRRMFTPHDVLPGETPVPQEYRLVALSVALGQLGPFTERPELYRSPVNPDGLDPVLWQAVEALHTANLFFDTQGPVDFRVSGLESFVVMDRRSRLEGVPGKYFLYRWEDLGSNAVWAATPGAILQDPSWSAVKKLYAN